MKTAISMDDALSQKAEETARQMGLSRSGFVALAVGDFLQRRRPQEILLRLNEVYAERTQSPEKQLVKGIKTRVRRTVNERW